VTKQTDTDERQHVDESDEYSQMFGIVIGHPPQCDFFREIEDGYEIDATPNSELRELIQEWRSDKYRHDPGFHGAADQLEAVIDDA